VRASLQGYAAAVLDDAAASGDAALAAEELSQVRDLVVGTPQLFSVVTDVGVPVAARRDPIDDLLASRLSAGTVALVRRAVTDERGPDLPIALDELAQRARLRVELGGAEVEEEEPVLGRSATRRRAAGYADAVLGALDRVEDIEEVEDQLFRFARIVEASDELRVALSDSSRSAAERRDLVASLLADRVLPATVRLARAALHPRIRDVVAELDAMVDEAARARGWRVARVRTARPIDEAEQVHLAEALRSVAGVPVQLQETEDPSLLGGAVIEIGDLLIDASAKHRLDQLEDHLLGPEGATRGAKS
jgi:F-type H+-transporting ATPase subunit delta